VDLDLPNDGDLDWVIGHDRMATRQGSAAQGQVHVGDLATQRLGSSVDNSSNGMAARSKLTHVDFLGGGSTIMGLVSAFFYLLLVRFVVAAKLPQLLIFLKISYKFI
jgi:hypothetical protein